MNIIKIGKYCTIVVILKTAIQIHQRYFILIVGTWILQNLHIVYFIHTTHQVIIICKYNE